MTTPDNKRNGRRNNKKKLHPKILAGLKPCKPGEIRNPKGISGKRKRIPDYVHDKLMECRMFKDRHGISSMYSCEERLGELWVDLALEQAENRNRDPWAFKALIDRIYPVPKQSVVLNQTTQTVTVVGNSQAFLDSVREQTGREVITSQDVLAVLHERRRKRLGPGDGTDPDDTPNTS